MERRKVQRVRTYFQGRIDFTQGLLLTECLVRDLSAGGARLALPATVAVPDEFEITIAQRSLSCRAKTVWSRPHEVGIAFLESNVSVTQEPSNAAERIRTLERERSALKTKIAQLNEFA
jgi:hypothetical protein